jgi:hypothetical protein
VKKDCNCLSTKGYDVVIDPLLKNQSIVNGVIVCGVEKKENGNKLIMVGSLGIQDFFNLPFVRIICVLWEG